MTPFLSPLAPLAALLRTVAEKATRQRSDGVTGMRSLKVPVTWYHLPWSSFHRECGAKGICPIAVLDGVTAWMNGSGVPDLRESEGGKSGKLGHGPDRFQLRVLVVGGVVQIGNAV